MKRKINLKVKMFNIKEIKNDKVKILSLIYLGFLIIFLFFLNCAKTPEEKQLIKTGKEKLKIKLEGVVKPYRKAKILAPISGTVEKIYFNNGDWVNEGDIIYKVKSKELDMEINNLKRDIQLIDGLIKSNNSLYYSVSRSKRRLIEVAREQLNRIAALYAKNYATKAELEAAEEKYFRLIDDEKATTDSYKTRRANLLQQKKAKIDALKKLQLKRSNVEVKSPISGYLTGLTMVEGQEVSKGSIVGYILNINKVVVKAGIASGLYRFIHEGDEVKIDFITTPPYSTKAKISKVIPIVDPKIGRMVVEINLDNYNYLLQDGTKAIITIIPNEKAQAILYKDFYKKGSPIIEIKTNIK